MTAKTILAKIDALRRDRGIKSERALGIKAGVGPDYLRQMRNGRNTDPSVEKLSKVAAALGVTITDLLPTPSTQPEDGRRAVYQSLSPEAAKITGPQPQVSDLFMPLSIQEVDIPLDQASDISAEKNVVAHWELPALLVRGQTSTDAKFLKVLPVLGDSMAPDFLPGERVLVDTAHRTPSPPGVYVIFDGLGLVLKRLELVPQSDPPMVRLIPVRKDYETHTLPLSTIQIRARVIGKWTWT